LSELEETLAWQIKAIGLPEPYTQYKFCPTRDWLVDFAWPDRRVILEVEGGIYKAKSGHRSYSGITRDIEKYNMATWLGWQVYRVTPVMVKNGDALNLIEKVLTGAM